MSQHVGFKPDPSFNSMQYNKTNRFMMFNVHLQSTDVNFSLMEKAQINMYCYDLWAKLDNYNYYLFHCVFNSNITIYAVSALFRLQL